MSVDQFSRIQDVPPGERGLVQLGAGMNTTGSPLTLTVHVYHGARGGPTLALVATTHGDEWSAIESLRRLLGELDLETLRGRLLVVPVAHPSALATATHQLPGEPDFQHALPGGQATLTERLAALLAEHVLQQSDALLDFHGGCWGQLVGCVAYGGDYPNPAVSEEARALARAFGWPYLQARAVFSTHPGPRSVLGWFGGELSRPAAAIELGGAGFGAEWDERMTLAQLRGLRNVLRHLEMLPGRPELPARFLHFGAVRNVQAPADGLLVSKVRTDHLGARLEEGELLGELYDPQRLRRIARLTCPGRGLLFHLRGNGPVQAGTSCFTLAALDDPETRWEET